MIETTNIRYHKPEIVLHPGDYKCTDRDIILSTILGSCISVILIDKNSRKCGMNHFMLPQIGNHQQDDELYQNNARYGIYAMEVLINELMKMGSKRSSLIAKVFGGGSVIDTQSKENNIGLANINFAFSFLSNERIPVVASDTGENYGRKIFYFSDTGRVLVKKLHANRRMRIIEEEESRLSKSIIEKSRKSEIILFKDQ